MDWDEEYDLVVLGAGAGGLTAALVAATLGMRAMLLEKTEQLGGTTARSGGAVWLPKDPEAHRYLDALVGERAGRPLREAFLDAGPKMLEYLQAHSEVRFEHAPGEVDYRQDIPAAAIGRAFRPEPYDGRQLGAAFERIAPPLPELTVFGGMMVTRAEVARLLRFSRSWDSFVLAAGLTFRYLMDRVRYTRGTRLVLGNALVARLYKSLLDRRVPIRFGAACAELVSDRRRVEGVIVEEQGRWRRIRARRGVVLAGGGFPASATLRRRFLRQPVAEYTAASPGCTGDTILLAERIGAALAGNEDNALWFPSSVASRRDGSTAVFPHIVLDRPKPGLIAVNRAGRRFVNEAAAYHEFVRAMYRSHQSVPTIPAFLICDRAFLWKYGLGMVRPHTLSLGRFVRSGYLRTARTLEGLASKIGVDPADFKATIFRYNDFARTGVDEDYGKGENAYDRSNGDPSQAPNPCVGAISKPPYFSVAIFPTPLGTSLGLRANEHGQVLDGAGLPIDGLYACGNDMESVMGGEYPGPGAQLGPAMTFGYLIAQHAFQTSQATRERIL